MNLHLPEIGFLTGPFLSCVLKYPSVSSLKKCRLASKLYHVENVIFMRMDKIIRSRIYYIYGTKHPYMNFCITYLFRKIFSIFSKISAPHQSLTEKFKHRGKRFMITDRYAIVINVIKLPFASRHERLWRK